MAIKLRANPTFRAKVEIPGAGGETVSIEFEFKHKTVTELAAFFEGEKKNQRSNADAALDLIAGWTDTETPFTPGALVELFDNYHAAPGALFRAYTQELTQAKLGN